MLDLYTLQLPKAGMDIILAGLNELPHKVVRGVYDSTLRQLQDQEQKFIQEQGAGTPAEVQS
jgi:hypothetical protein